MNFPPHFLVLLFKTAFHLYASTKFALLGLNLFIFWRASISSMILLGFSDFWPSNRLENPVAIYPSMTVIPTYTKTLKIFCLVVLRFIIRQSIIKTLYWPTFGLITIYSKMRKTTSSGFKRGKRYRVENRKSFHRQIIGRWKKNPAWL